MGVSEAIPQLIRNRKRFEEILRTLMKYGFADWVQDWNPDFVKGWFKARDGASITDMPAEIRLRKTLEELGTTFIKLGQMLSTRADLVGPEMAGELSKLQSGTPADSPETVRETFQAELGQSPEEIYAEFSDQALASASIGQVHAARLRDGTSVVVKVQHAAIQEVVRGDLEILTALAGIAERYSAEARQYQAKGLVAAFRRSLMRELDFSLERRNLDQFTRNFEEDETVHFPIAFEQHSTKRVLTMERLEGSGIGDREAIEAQGITSKEFAKRGANAYLEMIFRDGFYHADPHPGNLMALAGGVVGFLDCGMAGRVDGQTREDFEGLIHALVSQDSEALTESVIRIGTPPHGLDRDALRIELSEFVGDYVGSSLTDIDMGGALNGALEIVRNYHIVLRPDISMLLKALALLEGTSRLIDRDFSLAELMQPYYAKIVLRRMSPKALLRKAQGRYREWDRFLGLLPKAGTDILSQMQRGEIHVQMEHRRLEAATNRLVHGVLAAALFVGSAAMWAFAAPPRVWGVSLPGAAGVFVAAFLGYRLMRAIKRDCRPD